MPKVLCSYTNCRYYRDGKCGVRNDPIKLNGGKCENFKHTEKYELFMNLFGCNIRGSRQKEEMGG